MRRTLTGLILAATCSLPAGAADTIMADVVVEYTPSPSMRHLQQPYGGTRAQFRHTCHPWRLDDLTYATDGNRDSFVSLPKGAVVVLDFSAGAVFDGPGDDLFVAEAGNAAELADIYISSDRGRTFTLLGRAHGNRVTRFDLGAIGFTAQVNAVKVEGLDSKGGSPGFDLAYVQGLEGSVTLGGAEGAAPVEDGPAFSVGLG